VHLSHSLVPYHGEAHDKDKNKNMGCHCCCYGCCYYCWPRSLLLLMFEYNIVLNVKLCHLKLHGRMRANVCHNKLHCIACSLWYFGGYASSSQPSSSYASSSQPSSSLFHRIVVCKFCTLLHVYRQIHVL